MICLKDYIGLIDCDGATSLSGLYINQLPGVDLRMIDSLASEEQQNYVGVWDDVQERAMQRFRNDVISEFGKRYKIKTVHTSIDMEKTVDKDIVYPIDAYKYKGFTIELNEANASFTGSNLQNIYIQSLKYFAKDTVAINVYFFNLETGLLELTKQVSGVANTWVNLNVFTQFNTSRLFVALDTDAVDVYSKDISRITSIDYSDNHGLFIDSCGCNTVWRLRGAKAETNDLELVYGNDSFGISAIWSIRCSYEPIVCNNLDAFKSAWLYCLGAELMKERIYSNRLNEFTTIKIDKAKDMLKLFEAMYRGGIVDEVRYDGELTNAVYSINLNNNDCCLECMSPFTTTWNGL
jgi:hypothetical protein